MRVLARTPRQRWITSIVVAAGLAAAATGCASARIKRENALALAAADGKVLEGCYPCLQDARRTYERLASWKGSKKSLPGIVVRLFETDLLLALREREMGIDASASLERARSLVPRVPAAIEPGRVLALVDHMLPDGHATATKTTESLLKANRGFVASLDRELTWVEQAALTPPVRKYIALALDCSYASRYPNSNDTTIALAKRRQIPINAPPLVAYRAANCAQDDTLALKRVLATVPTFDEAAYALGNVVVFNAGETGGEDARQYYASAHARFPRAAGVMFMSAWLNLNIGDCDEAIRLYDSTIAMVPDHERALLQKTMCQSRTHQDSAAIATATRFISLETPDVSEGYYWRAVSRLRRRELDLARGDVDTAKVRSNGGTGEVLTVAGIIEHEQADFGIAEKDLRGARAAWKGYENCTAAFYLGSVLTKREAWMDAAASYDSAMVCYDEKVNKTLGMIERVRRSTKGSEAYRAKRLTSLESDLADLRKRYYTSAFNAASMNARLANYARAEELLAIATQSTDLTDQVAKLRDQIAQLNRPTAPSARQRPVPREKLR